MERLYANGFGCAVNVFTYYRWNLSANGKEQELEISRKNSKSIYVNSDCGMYIYICGCKICIIDNWRRKICYCSTIAQSIYSTVILFVSINTFWMACFRSNWERKRNNTYNDYYRIFADWRTFNFIINWTV